MIEEGDNSCFLVTVPHILELDIFTVWIREEQMKYAISDQ